MLLKCSSTRIPVQSKGFTRNYTFRRGGVFFIGCLRLSYFKEWRFNADMKEAFGVLDRLNRCYGIREFGCEWRYVSTLNFYRKYYGNDSMRAFEALRSYRGDRRAYVLYYPGDREFIEKEGLRVVYRGSLSNLVVATRALPEKGCSE